MRGTKQRLLSLLLVLVMVLGLLPGTAWAAGEITVTVKFDASVVAENMDQLYRDLKNAYILSEETRIPDPITVTVPSGSTVKEVLQAAQQKENFTIIGLDDEGSYGAYVTQVGFIGNDVLKFLVADSLFTYPNNFSNAGWMFYINGVGLSTGVSYDTVTEDQSIVEGRYNLYGAWNSSSYSMEWYDEQFINNYYELKELINESVDTTDFTESDIARLEQAKEQGRNLLTSIYNEANLSNGVKNDLAELDSDFHTDGGMWLGYYESKGTTLYGPGSPTEQLEQAVDNLRNQINRVPDNQLKSLVIANLLGDTENNEISFMSDVTDYVVSNYDTHYSTFQSYIKYQAEPNYGDASVVVKLNDIEQTLPTSPWTTISNLKWTAYCNTLTFTVTPPVGSASLPTTYTVKVYRTLTDAEKVALAKEQLIWSTIKGLNQTSTSVTSSLMLPQMVTLPDGQGDVNVSWGSSNGMVVKNDGTVVRPQEITNVTLTATIQSGTAQETKEFSVTVKPVTAADVQMDQVNKLLEGIASGYQNTYSNSKVIIDMAAYKALNPSTSYQTTSTAKQNYVNFTLSALTENNVAETTYSLAILGLQGIGVNPRALYPVNSNTAIDAVAGLNSVSHSASAWTAPYTLAAYNQGNYGTDAYEQALIADVLGAQRSDGSWTEYDDSIQTTANMITGLSFYYKTSDDVKTAVDKGISYLSTQQKADGTFDAYGYGSDADSCANVVTALASVGIRPDTDTRFVKEGNSALDGLMTFALADNSGFGYRDNTTKNDYATEEGFRALIAAAQVMSTGTAYNIYDFSGNVVAPGRATGEGAVEKPSTPNTDHTISVYFTLKSDVDYWIPRTTVTVKEGSTVYHVFTQALDDAGITYTGAENGYVTSITKGSKTLAEFSKGENSGWLYKVNGDLPDVGLTSYVLEDGDNVLWYYTEDWTKDSAAGLKQPAISSDAKVTENTDGTYTVTLPEDSDGPVRVVIPNVKDGQIVVIVGKDGSEKVVKKSVVRNGSAYLLLEADATVRVVDRANAFGDVTANDWYAAAVDFVTGRGLFSGVTEDEFAPNMTLNRGMLVTVLYALEEPGKLTGKGSFYDVSPDVWYAQGVAWATQAGIVSGFGDGLFGPEEPITREQLALMLYQYAKIQGLSTGANTSLIGFRDQGDVSSWAREAVTWAVEAGIISGRPDGTLDPAGTATRAEAAVMLRQLVTLMTQA